MNSLSFVPSRKYPRPEIEAPCQAMPEKTQVGGSGFSSSTEIACGSWARTTEQAVMTARTGQRWKLPGNRGTGIIFIRKD